MPAPVTTRESANQSSLKVWGRSLFNRIFSPVDISLLVLFRIIFSAAMIWTVLDLFANGSIASDYIQPQFHFTFHGFSWIRPWAGAGMYLHFAAIALLSAFVGIGFLYPLSAALLFFSFTYVFLLEKALYLNHYYLMCLLCLVQIFLPANRRLSIDSLLRPSLRTDYVPAWTLWLLRFQIALPYLMGGIAKLNPDWLRGQPMSSWLKIAPLRYLLGPVVEQHWVAFIFSWGGAVFDLGIVPLLIWERTRKIAFIVVILFHLMNAFLFNIGVFPWLMIGATLVFFPPDWPRRLFQSKLRSEPHGTPNVRISFKQKAVYALLLFYVSFQLLIPFRFLLYPGNVLWTEEGHLFAWHMMLRTKVTGVQFIVSDPLRGTIERPDIMQWLTPRQFEEMTHDPEMMREFAHFVRDQYRKTGRNDVEVHVVALCSLNGRKPQLLIDATVDLARQPRTVFHQPWIVPLAEPFRWDPWDVPISEWLSQIDVGSTVNGPTPSQRER